LTLPWAEPGFGWTDEDPCAARFDNNDPDPLAFGGQEVAEGAKFRELSPLDFAMRWYLFVRTESCHANDFAKGKHRHPEREHHLLMVWSDERSSE
jgi:hypothetical protein